MNPKLYKFQLYGQLQRNLPKIYADARKAADEIGIPAEIRGKFGLTGGVSGCPALLSKDVADAVHSASRETIQLTSLVDKIREMVKSVYGDEYDAAPICTCEAGLWVSFDVLATPPMQGRGIPYRARYVVPYERHLHHHGSYGMPFPSKYKDIFADRGVTAGELGFYGKRLNNLDAVIVPLVGARYEAHGIKYHVVPLLSKVDPKASMERISGEAEKQANTLSAFSSLGYDLPGYGYGAKDARGTPQLQKMIGKLAQEYNVPYVCDNAGGLPFIGTDPREINADIMLYSMDKSAGAPTSGLAIGKEDVMINIRRALGMHGNRWGTTSSYAKAAYVVFDPGKEALVGQVVALEKLRNEPEKVTKPRQALFKIVTEEFAALPNELREGIIISESHNSKSVEINYENTWKEGKVGIPIFSIEDMYAGSNIIQRGLSEMGIVPCIAYDANILISGGLASDERGQLIEEKMRYGVKALVKMIEIILKYV